ncbi:MAG TPA: hypothetical protein ENG49_00545 [Candidatus Omnitrophica bacterium]|nr:hypothetical protein [Candidatus Omnitrophota bacterium]
MSKVVVLEGKEYHKDILKEKIERALDNYFSIFDAVSTQDKILLKPNLLMGAPLSEAITTHPVVIEATGQIFKERGLRSISLTILEDL